MLTDAYIGISVLFCFRVMRSGPNLLLPGKSRLGPERRGTKCVPVPTCSRRCRSMKARKGEDSTKSAPRFETLKKLITNHPCYCQPSIHTLPLQKDKTPSNERIHTSPAPPPVQTTPTTSPWKMPWVLRLGNQPVHSQQKLRRQSPHVRWPHSNKEATRHHTGRPRPIP